MNEKIKFGILGYGKISRTRFLPALRSANLATLGAIGTQHFDKVKSNFGKDVPILSYDDLISQGKKLIDAIYIALPNNLHTYWARKCINAGLNVLCEKPISNDPNSVKKCIDLARDKDVLFAEAFMYRTDNRHEEVRKMIENGFIGDVHLLEATFSYFLDDLNNIRLKKENWGGALMDIGCYGIDVARLITQKEPKKIFAKCLKGKKSGVDECVSITLIFESKIIALITASTCLKRENYYKIRGSKGIIKVPDSFVPKDKEERFIVIEKDTGEKIVKNFPGANAFEDEIDLFSKAVKLKDNSLLYPLENGLANSYLLNKAIKSMKEE